MAVIRVNQQHALSADDVKKRLTDLFKGYRSQYGIDHVWDGDVLRLKGTGVAGQAVIGASAVDVEVTLRFPVSAFKGQVEAGIRSDLAQHLAA